MESGGGGVTEHTLTCTDDAVVITVNGTTVTSPYTLQNGDVIVLKRTSPYYNVIITAGEDTYDTDIISPPIDIANSDIVIIRGEVNNSPGLAMSGFTINYTESSTVEVINFTISGTSYQAESGMTWQQWVASSYNTGGFTISGNMVAFTSGDHVSYQSTPVSATDTIINNRAYGTDIE